MSETDKAPSSLACTDLGPTVRELISLLELSAEAQDVGSDTWVAIKHAEHALAEHDNPSDASPAATGIKESVAFHTLLADEGEAYEGPELPSAITQQDSDAAAKALFLKNAAGWNHKDWDELHEDTRQLWRDEAAKRACVPPTSAIKEDLTPTIEALEEMSIRPIDKFSHRYFAGHAAALLKSLSASSARGITISRSLAERTEAMFRSVDPGGGIAQEWLRVLDIRKAER